MWPLKVELSPCQNILLKFYIKSKLRINCIAPGGVFDNQNKIFVKNYKKYSGLIGMLSGDEIADVILWLTTENTAITGQTITIDDGYTL